MDAIIAMGLQLLLGGVPLAFAAWAWEDPASVQWSAEFILLLSSLALLGTALPYWLWTSVLENAELSRANAYTFVVPMLGLAMGIIFFDERLGALATAGAALATLGVWLAQTTAQPGRRESGMDLA